ncbi:MAG: TonB-dependent receptor [Burkholderiaceae bacterium]|jgi:iron complex outermembrane receptor protein|nr:TonB-dependent receptor [Burkholderiales bacterium]MCZ8339113.1 TonB-dependent receptor [Burkholderiaceae bacterium]
MNRTLRPPFRRPPLVAALALSVTGPAFAQTAPAGTTQTLPPVVVRDAGAPGQLRIDEPSGTGSRLGLTPRETPASVTIVDRDTIEQRGALTTQDILQSVPGMIAAAPPGFAGYVAYRGFSGSQITQLFNGISVQYDAIAGRPVDSWIYDRVEVIGGPSTFLFGAGAVGGSINYVTKLATRDADFVEGRVRYGSYDTYELSVGLNRRLGQPSGDTGNTLRLDLSRTGSNGWVDGNARQSTTFAGSLLTDLGPRLSHTLAVEYQNEKVDRPYWGTPLLNPTTVEGRILPETRFANYNSNDGTYEQTVKWARSIIDWRASDATSVRNTLYLYDALRDYRNVEVYRFNAANTAVVRSAALLQRHDQELVGNRLEALHRSTLAGLPSDWSAGMDVSFNRQTRYPRSLPGTVSTVPPTGFVTEDFFSIPGMTPGFVADRTNRVDTVALFVENRTRVLPSTSLVTALRHDRIDLEVVNQRTVTATDPAVFQRTYRPTTGRIGVVQDLTPSASVYAQYATSADPPAGILTTANFSQLRDFDLSTGRQFEIGAKGDYLEGRGVATVAAYTIARENLSMADPSNPGTTVPIGKQSARGIELATSVRPVAGWLLAGNLAWVDPQFDEFTENVGGTAVSRAGNRPPNTPTRVANLWVDWAFAPGWNAGASARYVSHVYANAANTTSAPAYTLLGLSLGYRISRNLSLTARVDNLTDEVYAANVTGTPMYFLGPPRTYSLTLAARY